MKLIQRIKEGANRATEKAQHAVEISKINSQITAIQQEMDVHFLRMGQIFYEGYRASDMSVAETEMTQLSTACDELQDEIDELRSRIAQLKNAHLCTCGAVVPLDANFCPKCGRKLNEEQAASKQVASVREEIPTDVYSFDLRKPEAAKAAQPAYTEYTEQEVAERHEQEQDELHVMFEPAASAGSDRNYMSDFTPEEKAAFDEEWERRRQEEIEQEHLRLEELERERERQEELDERIRYWKANNSGAEKPATQIRENVKCQICTAELPKGSKWCPRCGAEQI
ncbi:zinc ribbon domain-containing protein [Paenibacillus sp. 1-18]|uniref:zinc ribbon domain-containing protein n=1 Tax=Paenibacillus sp. 1-18 TaxID=1333846 RepID=UPI0004709D60|nr:zinc ribbon domain-containing protein [Paenibacillus sp. 1-18]